MQKAYLTYNKNNPDGYKSLSGLTNDLTVKNKDIQSYIKQENLSIEQVGSIELSEQEYINFNVADEKNIVNDFVVLKTYTEAEKTLKANAEAKSKLTEQLINKQLRVDAMKKLLLDTTKEDAELLKLKSDYAKI